MVKRLHTATRCPRATVICIRTNSDIDPRYRVDTCGPRNCKVTCRPPNLPGSGLRLHRLTEPRTRVQNSAPIADGTHSGPCARSPNEMCRTFVYQQRPTAEPESRDSVATLSSLQIHGTRTLLELCPVPPAVRSDEQRPHFGVRPQTTAGTHRIHIFADIRALNSHHSWRTFISHQTAC